MPEGSDVVLMKPPYLQLLTERAAKGLISVPVGSPAILRSFKVGAASNS
jgi:hypothetical protein